MTDSSDHITGDAAEGIPRKAICGRKKFRGYMKLDTYLVAVATKNTRVLERVCVSCRKVAESLYGPKPVPVQTNNLLYDEDGMPRRSMMDVDRFGAI